MAILTNIPSDLTNHDRAFIFQFLDGQLNSTILYALLHGIYTGILAVTLWNIFINKCSPIQRVLVVVIIFLHTLITINFAAYGLWIHSGFIKNGQNFWTVFLTLEVSTPVPYWVIEITGSISTILADSYCIWCCWMVWGQCWLVVLLPIISLVSAIVSRAMMVYYYYIVSTLVDVFIMLYVSFILVTTLSCTLLIIYRIVAVVGVRHGAVGRLRVYHRFIEVLVESSALYSISLILDLAVTNYDVGWYGYFDIIVSIAKGIAPTLLIGRAAAGHTCPREDNDRSTVSSLHFQTPSEHSSTTSSQLEEPTIQSSVLAIDIEAQPAEQQSCPLNVNTEAEVSMTSRADRDIRD
ncbi:hypothetical protein F5146DRAFT_1189696 [Armillaria mellea]|nr:hypothetical protein F5146DRAFT_1189696 [Armillaria mellea]